MTSRLRDAKQIYECFVELSGPTATTEAQIRYTYPKDYEWDEETRKQIPKFTFPMKTSSDTEEHFTFVLTDLDSRYRFGFCRYPPKGGTCICFISDLPWFKVFYRSLDKISDLRLDHQDELVEPFLAGLRSHPIPALGMETVLSVVPEGVETGQVYTFPLPNPKRLPEIPLDDNFTQFYTNLHYNVILHLFSNLLFERRIIITSSNLSLLSATVHGVVPLIFPLDWQHIFIPITPPHLLDYCAAPMPFLMGVHSSYMDLVRKMPIEDVVLLDVDESAMESPHVEDLEALPSDVVSELKHVLKKQASAYGDAVARSFLRAQVSMLGGYRSALKLRQGESEVVFDEEQFLRSRPNSEEFLEKLLHFQHFRQFMNHKIDKLKNRSLERDRFDEEVLMWEESTDKYKVNFEKFINSTVKLGDQIKETSGRLGRKMRKKAKIVWKKLDNVKNQSHHHHSGGGPLLPQGKTQSLPGHKSPNDGVLFRSVTTPPPVSHGGFPLSVKTPRKPPPVIPYQRHREGKQRLAESLRLQNSGEPLVGNLVNFTPPGTPKSGEQSERQSLDSRTSIDVSVQSGEVPSGEVAVGNLVDITPNAVVFATSDTDSVSSASSSGSSSGNSVPIQTKQIRQWETFDNLDKQRPPLPPPRAELEQQLLEIPRENRNRSLTPVDEPIDSPSDTTNPFQNFDFEAPNQEQSTTELSFNLVESDLDRGGLRPNENGPSPFESLHLSTRAQSPFDDFSSSIGQALMDNSTKLDPLATNAMTNTGQELAKTTEEDNDKGDLILENSVGIIQPMVQPLVPTTTLAAPTQAIPTEMLRTHANLRNDSAPTISSAVATASIGYYTSASAPNFHQLQPTNMYSTYAQYPGYYYQAYGYQNMTYTSKNLKRPSGPRAPKFAQDIPLSIPQVPLNTQRKRPPPPRPQPYSGAQVGKPQNTSDEDPMLQRLDSIGEFNPFQSLLAAEDMEAYVQRNTSNETPLV